MKRKSLQNLLKWSNTSHRKPLIIRGARQVGKSTLVRLFAEQEGLILHEVNLERHPKLGPVFAERDPKIILQELEFLIGKGPIQSDKSILFLDEIQAIPEALPVLRYFHEEMPDLRVIAAGSLLEFVLSEHKFSMPVGRIEYLFLEPMSFEEFLEAANETSLLDLLNSFHWSDSFPGSAHDRLLSRLRDYIFVGGMPEAILRYIESSEMQETSAVHASILETYRDDFAKYATMAERQRIQKVYDYLPGAVGEKFKFVNVDSSEQSRSIKRALELLVMARIIRRFSHSDGTGFPLGATLKLTLFKAFFLDVGLVNAACGVARLSTSALSEPGFINKGKIAEQFIAQHLPLLAPVDRNHVGTYWLREGRSNNAEIDFLIQLESDIVPLEIKAGKSGTLKSLLEFVHLRGLSWGVRLDANVPRIQRVSHKRTKETSGACTTFSLLSLPLYMVEQLPRLWGVRGL